MLATCSICFSLCGILSGLCDVWSTNLLWKILFWATESKIFFNGVSIFPSFYQVFSNLAKNCLKIYYTNFQLFLFYKLLCFIKYKSHPYFHWRVNIPRFTLIKTLVLPVFTEKTQIFTTFTSNGEWIYSIIYILLIYNIIYIIYNTNLYKWKIKKISQYPL